MGCGWCEDCCWWILLEDDFATLIFEKNIGSLRYDLQLHPLLCFIHRWNLLISRGGFCWHDLVWPYQSTEKTVRRKTCGQNTKSKRPKSSKFERDHSKTTIGFFWNPNGRCRFVSWPEKQPNQPTLFLRWWFPKPQLFVASACRNTSHMSSDLADSPHQGGLGRLTGHLAVLHFMVLGIRNTFLVGR